MPTVTHKVCSLCRLEKNAEEFSPDKRATTGLQPRCRQCCSKCRKDRRDANIEEYREKEKIYFLANKERVYAQNAKSREKNSDKIKHDKKMAYERDKHKPEFQKTSMLYRERTKKQKSEYDKEYRKRDPEKHLKRAQKWRKNNPEKRAAIIHAYSARRRQKSGDGVSTKELSDWKASQKKSCYWCGKRCKKSYHIDHYYPLSKGGKHELSNLVIACKKCNLTKSAKDPLDFALQMGRLF